MKLCVLTERRVFQPYGMSGGQSGARGRNTLIRKNGKHLNLGSKSEIEVETGVRKQFIFLSVHFLLIF